MFSGRIVGFSYLVGNTCLQDIRSRSPVVCSASSDGTVRAWDVHKVIYSTPVNLQLGVFVM